jgi:hypothetical protein
MSSDFRASLPQLTEASQTKRGTPATATFKLFLVDGSAAVCRWTGAAWEHFGTLPGDDHLTAEKAGAIVASLEERQRAAQEAPSAVPAAALKASLDEVAAFAAAFAGEDRTSFAFTAAHAGSLQRLNQAVAVVSQAVRSEPKVLFHLLFATPTAEAPDHGSALPVVCDAIDLLTNGIENMVGLPKEEYNADVMLECGKARLELLQVVQAVGSNEAATMRLAALAALGREDSGGGAAAGAAAGGGGGGGGDTSDSIDCSAASAASAAATSAARAGRPRPPPLDLTTVVINVLHATSAKFDFVAVRVATNLLRNWALCPDVAFRRQLITRNRAVSAVVALFLHKDENVAGTAIATLRHMCLDPHMNALVHMVCARARARVCAVLCSAVRTCCAERVRLLCMDVRGDACVRVNVLGWHGACTRVVVMVRACVRACVARVAWALPLVSCHRQHLNFTGPHRSGRCRFCSHGAFFPDGAAAGASCRSRRVWKVPLRTYYPGT